MIIGVGTDIVEIQRIADAVNRWGDHFLNRIFTETECDYCMTRHNDPYPHLAARFAAKESIIKALTPIRTLSDGTPRLVDIEIRNEISGLPQVHVYGTFETVLKYYNLFISISHEKHYAIAMAVLARNISQTV
jgi:holo-[acyl-carrier protein] synthase